MTDDPETTAALLRRLCAAQYLGVLATEGAGRPYTSLVAFVASEDLRYLYFATPRATRKYANLIAHPEAAMHIDDRANRPADIQGAISVTALGRVAETAGAAREEAEQLYLSKQPHLAEFVAAPGCALMRMEVEAYVAAGFQRAVEWRPDRPHPLAHPATPLTRTQTHCPRDAP